MLKLFIIYEYANATSMTDDRRLRLAEDLPSIGFFRQLLLCPATYCFVNFVDKSNANQTLNLRQIYFIVIENEIFWIKEIKDVFNTSAISWLLTETTNTACHLVCVIITRDSNLIDT